VLIDENRKLLDALMAKVRPPLPEAYLKLPQVRRQKPCSA